ncbi:MAG: CRTAC1 family protein [Acidobacteriota bacterium]
MIRRPLYCFGLVLLLGLGRGLPSTLPTVPPRFVDIASEAGLLFQHTNGASGQFYFPEIVGSGGALLDYDNDGYLDVFLVNSCFLTPGESPGEPRCRLYRNRGQANFVDVTEQAGIALSDFFGMGVAVGDYDNDGDPDLYLTGYGRSALLRNNGNGTFTEVTEIAKVGNQGHWGTSAGFFDFDRDGFLDLFVCNYVTYHLEGDPCHDGGVRSYCHPDLFESDHNVLYRNRGDGTFSDQTLTSRLGRFKGKALGVAFLDYDDDGWIDVFVANDQVPNFLLRNNGDGTFQDMAMVAGVAYDENGHARAGMGVDAGDYDNDGQIDILITNFTSEGNALFRNRGDGSFVEVTYTTGILEGSFRNVGFGARFFDADNDGDLDVFVTSGHVAPNIDKFRDDVTFKQRKLLYINANGRFQECSQAAGGSFDLVDVGRGAAFGDIDNDGDIDILVTNNAGRVNLLRNEGHNQNWIALKLVGKESNRDAVGALIRVKMGERIQTATAGRSGSYLSAHDPRVHFGLGATEVIDAIEITWPSGIHQKIQNVAANRILTVHETRSPEGVTASQVLQSGEEEFLAESPSSLEAGPAPPESQP